VTAPVEQDGEGPPQVSRALRVLVFRLAAVMAVGAALVVVVRACA
jgi:hypothetical protein